ncbi:MAG: hypothetical protein PWR13_1330, partial [Archaeoglobi archaeon]|nr:hypothetical protein [Archaeoglobi archaeon]
SGSRDLDEIFHGGFTKGSSILLEISEGVPRRMYYRFLQSFYLNFLRKGKRVYIIPALGTDRERIVNEMRPFLREDELENLIFIERGWGRERIPKEFSEERAREVYEKHRKRISEIRENLAVIGTDSIYSRYGEGALRAFETGVVTTQEAKALAIAIAKPGFPLMKELSNLSNIHVKMENVCNVPVIRGVKPKTQYYAMLVDLSEGFPRLRFEKVE